MPRLALPLALCLLLAGAAILAADAARAVRGAVASACVEAAWLRHRVTGAPVRPWPWADTHPIAVLLFPRLGERHVVLEGAFGDALAHGPARVLGTALPGSPGNAVLAAHRDGAFRRLGELRPGDVARVTTARGRATYAVAERLVVDARDTRWLEDDGTARLTLVTCYPLDGIARPAQRYVVRLTRAEGE